MASKNTAVVFLGLLALAFVVESAPIANLPQQLGEGYVPAAFVPVDGIGSNPEPIEHQDVLEVAESQRIFSSKQETQSLEEKRNNIGDADDLPESKMLEDFIYFGRDSNLTDDKSLYKLGYSIDDGRFKSFRYEEKTPEGLIVGELGYHSDTGNIRGVRYTAEAGVHPKILYDALLKFFSL